MDTLPIDDVKYISFVENVQAEAKRKMCVEKTTVTGSKYNYTNFIWERFVGDNKIDYYTSKREKRYPPTRGIMQLIDCLCNSYDNVLFPLNCNVTLNIEYHDNVYQHCIPNYQFRFAKNDENIKHINVNCWGEVKITMECENTHKTCVYFLNYKTWSKECVCGKHKMVIENFDLSKYDLPNWTIVKDAAYWVALMFKKRSKTTFDIKDQFIEPQ